MCSPTIDANNLYTGIYFSDSRLDSKGTTMYKKILVGLLVFGLLTTILAACAIRDEAGTSGPDAHMGSATFVQPSVTINNGDSLTLVDGVAVEHIIETGSVSGTTQKPATVSGATALNTTCNGTASVPVGPFNTT